MIPRRSQSCDELDWRAFERLVADVFDGLGYETKCIGGKRDHGADVIAERGKERIAIQVKHRRNRKWVGETAVRAVVTARPVHGCNRGIVVTNSSFAPGTAEIAAIHDVELGTAIVFATSCFRSACCAVSM